MSGRLFSIMLAMICVIASTKVALAKEPVLSLSFDGQTRTFTTSQLLARPDIAELVIPTDVAYGTRMIFKAVPLMALLGRHAHMKFDTLQASTTDGFISQLPMELIKRGASGGAVAWLAIEPPTRRWPKLPKKQINAGPFYLVWQHPERSNIGPEQWPYALATLSGVHSPMQRWPQMVVATSIGKSAPARRGMRIYIKHCLSCHRISGAGEATVGPDLTRPMSATDYMTVKGLRALLRDPASVRTWPKQEMPGFNKEVLPDHDLDDLIAYLKHMGEQETAR